MLYCIVGTVDMSSHYQRIVEYMNQTHVSATEDVLVIAALQRDTGHEPIASHFYSPL